MTTIGKVCLWLTVIGLGVVSVWLLPNVGKKHNDISAELVDSKNALDKAIDAHTIQTQKLDEGQHQLARLKIGWDKSWTVQQTANSGVKFQGQRLAVNGLGLDSGLGPVLDDAGQEVKPVVHAFKMLPEGGVFYAGEFKADKLDAAFCTLVPNWTVTQEEQNAWMKNPELPWRFRTLVPAAKRLKIDRAHGQLQELREILAEVQANVAQQQALQHQAETQLTIRKQELLGNPDAEQTPGHPEYSDGLLKTISAEEDRRNDLLITVNELRREIKQAGERREQLRGQLEEITEQLPSAQDGRITQTGTVAQ